MFIIVEYEIYVLFFIVCLKNLHLVISWLPNLEKELKNLQDVHPNFKCWMTTEAH